MKKLMIILTIVFSTPSYSLTYIKLGNTITGDDAIKGASVLQRGERALFDTHKEGQNKVDNEMKLIEGSWQSVSYQCEGEDIAYPSIYSVQRLDIKSGIVTNTVSNLNCIIQEEIEIDFANEQEGIISYHQLSGRVISKSCIEENDNNTNGKFEFFINKKYQNDLALRVKNVNCHGKNNVLFYFKRLGQ